MKIENVKIYDLEESLHASGYPMRTTTNFEENNELERGAKLSRAADWVGAHDQFLTGIRVNFDLTFSNKAWVEAERYRFLEFVSSQSTMHRMIKFNLDDTYNKYVDCRIIQIMKEKVAKYYEASQDPKTSKELLDRLYLELLYSNPAGFELTARMATNYRCLKNIWRQRRFHRLPEWREFCAWIETLPYADELLCFESRETNKEIDEAKKNEVEIKDKTLKVELNVDLDELAKKVCEQFGYLPPPINEQFFPFSTTPYTPTSPYTVWCDTNYGTTTTNPRGTSKE